MPMLSEVFVVRWETRNGVEGQTYGEYEAAIRHAGSLRDAGRHVALYHGKMSGMWEEVTQW